MQVSKMMWNTLNEIINRKKRKMKSEKEFFDSNSTDSTKGNCQ